MGGLSNWPIPDPFVLPNPSDFGSESPPFKFRPTGWRLTNEWTQIEHNMCGRRAPRSPLWWWPCTVSFIVFCNTHKFANVTALCIHSPNPPTHDTQKHYTMIAIFLHIQLKGWYSLCLRTLGKNGVSIASMVLVFQTLGNKVASKLEGTLRHCSLVHR